MIIVSCLKIWWVRVVRIFIAKQSWYGIVTLICACALLLQAPKASKKKQVKASLGQVGKAAKKMNMGYDNDDDLGADFDDFM